MHVLVSARDSLEWLREEIRRALPQTTHQTRGDNLLLLKGAPPLSQPAVPLAFARQCLPEAEFVAADSIRLWSERVFQRLPDRDPQPTPWRLHLAANYGDARAGQNRLELIGQDLEVRLRKHRRHLLRHLRRDADPFQPEESLVQLLLLSPDTGFLSVAHAPVPSQQPHWISPYPLGEIEVAPDPAAPCRAFAKLVEAEVRLGASIEEGQTCVDLGACPGSWSYVALARGASVTAVDRSPPRLDVLGHRNCRFLRGDAFTYVPEEPVDWLLCDVVAAPQRSIDLLLDWIEHRRCRRFIVTIKFKGTTEYALLEPLKQALLLRTSRLVFTRLCANRNEVCAAGCLV